jgi:hypothetical protein
MFVIVVVAPSNSIVNRVAASAGKDPLEVRGLSVVAVYLDAHPT